MSGKTIIEQCSPTLAGIKTASLFSVEFSNPEEELREIRALNRMLRKKGIRAVPVRKKNNRTLIYLYRPAFLQKDFCDPHASEILKEKGYSPDNSDKCIVQLVRRLAADEDFPHEIGLFLGYPPADVRGFMNSPKDGVQLVGYWKVYSDREKAENTFQKYKKCTDLFQKLYQDGASLVQLTVAG